MMQEPGNAGFRSAVMALGATYWLVAKRMQ